MVFYNKIAKLVVGGIKTNFRVEAIILNPLFIQSVGDDIMLT